MAKYAAASAGLLLPAALAGQAGLFSSYVSLSVELIGFPDWAGKKFLFWRFQFEGIV